MKINYKPKMLPIECTRCGCVYTPKRKNLTTVAESTIKDNVHCPICNTPNSANFERLAKKEERSENGKS
jgi:rubredoxin